MEKITSFTIDHDLLKRGIYLSRTDGDVLTYDLRMKEPNRGDYLENAVLHTFEHLFATYARNSAYKDSILYFGPMGCRTGFYLLVRDALSPADVIDLTQSALRFIADYSDEIPGSKKEECGNFAEHDLKGARAEASEYLQAIDGLAPADLVYPQ